MGRVALLTTPLKIRRKSIAGRMSRVDLVTRQNRWWVDAHGRVHDVARITPEYQDALLAYLRQNAWRIRWLGLWQLGDPYGDDFEYNQIADQIAGAQDWIEQQPLVARLRGLVEAR